MAPPNPFERRHSPAALVVSLIVHGGLVAVVLTGVLKMAPVGTVSALPGLVSNTRGGGGGGVEMRYVALGTPAAPPAVPAPVVPPPLLVAPVEAPEVLPEPAPATQLVAAPDSLATAGGAGVGGGAGPGSGGGTGGGTGTGRGTGTGSGTGAGSGGEEGRAIPPEPRQMIIPPEFPPSMRGWRIAVIFDVSADGRVRQVEFDPSVPDRGYARRLEAVMRDYRFHPARNAEGREVAGVARVVLRF